MPIEFQCVQCQKLLRTPDESAGKKARCPQCGTILEIPVMPPRISPLSSNSWENPDSSGAPNPSNADASFEAAGQANPYAPPPFNPSFSQPNEFQSSERDGLPWETEGKSFRTYWATATLILKDPETGFRKMRKTGDLLTPMLFSMLGMTCCLLIAFAFMALFQIALFAIAAVGAKNEGGGAPVAGALIGVGFIQIFFGFIWAISAGTLGSIVGMFVSGGIYHLCLMMLGVAKQPYETTCRVVAYSQGSAALITMIPVCGISISNIVTLIYVILGIRTAHETSGWKATLAVLLPFIVCCGGGAILYGLIVFALIAGGTAR